MKKNIARTIEQEISKYREGTSKKILFIWGPRRAGKTTVLKKIAASENLPIFNFDLISDREKFPPDLAVLKKIASEHKLILIDEVQNYPESTLALKILHDELAVKIIATGSSELRQTSKDFDSLAGRFTQIFCLPASIFEIEKEVQTKAYDQNDFFNKLATDAQLYGLYPEVYLSTASEDEKIDLLQNILDTYVLKDVIDIYNLKNTKLAKDILTKIALQIGSEVSVREISSSLQANVVTVNSYIEIFIKNYILIPLPSFKTNLRRAVSENRKLYFYDVGIRNILVKDFRPLELRPDAGGVFENFIVVELEKWRKILNIKKSLYFYREFGGKEIDIVLEDYHKNYVCIEIKRSTNGQAKNIFPLPHEILLLNPHNYQAMIKQALLS